MHAILIASFALEALSWSAPAESASSRGTLFLVVDGESTDSLPAPILEAGKALVGGRAERLLAPARDYRAQFAAPLGVSGYPAGDALTKARWLRDWLAHKVAPGSTLVFLGDETVVPTWQVRLGGLTLTTDCFYSDLNDDGIPETGVTRIVGPAEVMIRQLRGKAEYGRRAVILCSEDTRIHMETRAFMRELLGFGYDVAIRGSRDDEALSNSDFIIHFGHGSPSEISNRFGERFAGSDDETPLPRSPVVFVDGCGTLPVGSPLLLSFLRRGAIAYVGATAVVQGMTPARFTNELVEHFLAARAHRPEATIPELLSTARAAYINGHPGLAQTMRDLASTGAVNAAGELMADLLVVTEWVCYGDPRARVPAVGAPRERIREAFSMTAPVRLGSNAPAWRATFALGAEEGRAVLALHVDIPHADRSTFSLSVQQDGKEIVTADGRHDTVYQNLGNDCRGGYVANDTYRARFLLPLVSTPGEHALELRLARGGSATLTPGTRIDVWPRDFEKEIGLRHAPLPRAPVPREPAKAKGTARAVPTGVEGFFALDLSGLFNRSHASTRVGGGDNASFRTWFKEDLVRAGTVPFVVRRTGNDVLVSGNNTENVFELEGIGESAHAIHVLVWGYSYPGAARLRIVFDGGGVQDLTLTLDEWTQGKGPVAFDFENTIPGFRHAAIAHHRFVVTQPEQKIARVESLSGTFGLVAITLEK